jgi:DNA mismatch repair protein MutS
MIMAKTPMMEQFTRIKEEYSNSILFFRVGDFYEMFYDDAKTAARELELTLTKRGKDSGKDIPLAGVPYHAAEQYIGRLVKKGYSVAICDQVEDPKKAVGIVRRDVTRVVTPGTVMEENLLDSSTNNYLCSICERGSKIALAWADISTKDFYVEEFTGPAANEELISELSMIDPSEILISENLREDVDFITFVKNMLGGKTIFRTFTIDYNLKEAMELLQDEFDLISLDGFGLAEYTQGLIAAAQIIDYVKNTQKEHDAKFLKIRPKKKSAYMLLDATTRSNLELTRTIRGEDDKGTLFSVLNRTKTAMGTRTLKEWLHQPLLTVEAIMERQEYISEFYGDRILVEDLVSELKNIYDLERLVSRLSFGSAGAKDLRMLGNSLKASGEIRSLLGENESFTELLKEIHDFSELVELLDTAIVENPPFSVREGGIFNTGFSEELDELRKIKSGGSQWMAELVENEKERTGIKSLKVKYNRVFGYFLEVTKSNIHMVPDNYIRKQTLGGCERYFTPELKEMENRILGASDKINKLEYDMFCEIRDRILKISSELLETAKSIARIDALISLSVSAIENNYVKPLVEKGDIIEIKGGRHPVVEKMDDVNFIANDTILDRETRLHIITGPNMAGKSTYIRQVALITLLAQIGSFVPASSARIGVVDRIFTRVGASDNLFRGQSTFMVEMVETANILNNATRDSLIILDEIGRGTSTYDGISIAWALAEYLSKGPRRIKGAATLFATHYHELTKLESALPGTKNFNVAVAEDNGEIIFVRKIVPGGADKSYGIHVASLAGIPVKVIEKAKRILKELEDDKKNHSMKNMSFQEDVNQLDLFAVVEPEVSELEKYVQEIDPDSLTPRDALDLLYKIKDLI